MHVISSSCSVMTWALIALWRRLQNYRWGCLRISVIYHYSLSDLRLSWSILQRPTGSISTRYTLSLVTNADLNVEKSYLDLIRILLTQFVRLLSSQMCFFGQCSSPLHITVHHFEILLVINTGLLIVGWYTVFWVSSEFSAYVSNTFVTISPYFRGRHTGTLADATTFRVVPTNHSHWKHTHS